MRPPFYGLKLFINFFFDMNKKIKRVDWKHNQVEPIDKYVQAGRKKFQTSTCLKKMQNKM